MRVWHRLKESLRVLSLLFSPGIILGIVLFEAIYWTSPQWAQTVGLWTHEGHKARAIVAATELLASVGKTDAVHDGGMPIPLGGLPEWTPVRVEQRFPSGFAVVSALGPHGNFQYIVRDLVLTEGTTFRVMNSVIIKI